MTIIHATYWNRYPLEKLTSQCLKRFADQYGMQVVAAISPEDPYYGELSPHLQSLGFDVIETANHPISDKHNYLARHILGKYDFDHLLQVGSDDIFLDDIMKYYDPHTDAPFVGTQQCYFWHPQSGRAVHFPGYKRKGYPLGPGRMIRREVLEELSGYLWKPGKKRGLDGSAYRQMKKVGIEPVTIDAPLFLDIKMGQNITDFERLKDQPSVEVDTVLSKLHPEDKHTLCALDS